MPIAHEHSIYRAGKYVGMLFAYQTPAGPRWTHSLLNHGSEMFASSAEATTDFWRTKANLPSQVHRQLFGEG